MGSQKWPWETVSRIIRVRIDDSYPTSVFDDKTGGNPRKTLNNRDGKNQNSRYHDRRSLGSLEEKRQEIEGRDVDLNGPTPLISLGHRGK
jgi:hypothetical protein